MSTSATEIIGAVTARPGQPIGQIVGGQVVPFSAQKKAHHEYPTFESLAEEVAATLDAKFPNLPMVFRRIYRNREGAWVRVVLSHTGETRDVKQEDGSVVTFAATVKSERPVALTIQQAAAALADWFQPGQGWVRKGTKREWDDPENLGHQATQAVEWEQLEYRSPSPSAEPVPGATPKKEK